MAAKKRLSCELALVIGLLLNSLCVSLMVKSGFGVSTLSSVPLVFSHIFTAISFGVWNFLAQGLCVVILVAVTRRFSVGYILSFFIGGIFGKLLDFYQQLLAPLPDEFGFRVLYFTMGFLLMTVGAALFQRCRLPVLPFDLFVRDLTAFLHLPVRRVKTTFDLVCVAITLALSFTMLGRLDGVGVGTILGALFTGILTNKVCDHLDRDFVFVEVWRKFTPGHHTVD